MARTNIEWVVQVSPLSKRLANGSEDALWALSLQQSTGAPSFALFAKGGKVKSDPPTSTEKQTCSFGDLGHPARTLCEVKPRCPRERLRLPLRLLRWETKRVRFDYPTLRKKREGWGTRRFAAGIKPKSSSPRPGPPLESISTRPLSKRIRADLRLKSDRPLIDRPNNAVAHHQASVDHHRRNFTP